MNDKDAVYHAAWKRFYVAKSLPTEGDGWLKGSQLVLMTSAGRLLSGTMKYGDRASMAQALREVLDGYAKLPESERRPPAVTSREQYVPAPPPGGLVLTIYDRPIAHAGGRYRLPEGDDLGGIRTEAPGGQRSSLWLTRDEWRSLIPPNPEPGRTRPVPAKLAKRICLYGLWPQTLWVVEHEWQPDSMREGELHVMVEEVSPQSLRLRLHGSVLLSANSRLKIYPTGKIAKELENRYDARLEGVLNYDRAADRITRWDMVALGDYTGAMFTHRVVNGQRVSDNPWREATAAAPVPLAFAFELDAGAYEAPPERRRPRSFVHAYTFRDREAFYWDPQLWEEDWKKRQPR